MRPPKTIETKRAQGTIRKDRELDHYLKYEPIKEIPAINKDLNPDGKAWFKQYTQIMIDQGLMTTSFLSDFEAHAFIYQSMKIFERILKDEGYYTVASTGWKQPNPAWKQLVEATKILTSFYQRYGLDLVSSQRINAPDVNTDKLDE